jgi:signal transduction histidine kinase
MAETGEIGQATAQGVDDPRKVPLARGLSAKLLVLTVLFVMLAEILIFLPSIANFRLNWLEERLGTAAAVSTVLVQGDPTSLTRTAQDEVLIALGARAVAVRDAGESRLMVVSQMPPQVDEHVNIGETSPVAAITGALDTLFFGGDRLLRAFGPVGESAKEFELIIPDTDLRKAMLVYARNVAGLSLLLSLFTAMFVYAAIDRIMIRPIRDMTRSMLAFAQAPDDASRIIRPEPRADEIGVAERELNAMQTNLQRTLGERKHLADLGLAVSKINHDMRNMLASAQLISDRLAEVRDPAVQSFAPKLLRAIDRAVAYSEGVLAYGRAQEPPPSRRRVALHQLVEEVFGLIGHDPGVTIDLLNKVAADFEVDADSEQLFRVLANLCRNAVEAMSADRDPAVIRRLTVDAERQGAVSRITVTDTGPGLPQKARENLFAAFRGSARSGGTGLGLAIAQELVRAHGGNIELVESIGGHTVFAISIPDQPVSLDTARNALRQHG